MFFTFILFLFLDYIYFRRHGSDCDRAWLLPTLVEPTPEVGIEPYLFERVFWREFIRFPTVGVQA